MSTNERDDQVQAISLLALLKAARANLAAVQIQVDAAISTLQERLPAPASRGNGQDSPGPDECEHNDRTPAPVMGDPGRSICLNPNCRAVVPGKQPEVQSA